MSKDDDNGEGEPERRRRAFRVLNTPKPNRCP